MKAFACILLCLLAWHFTSAQSAPGDHSYKEIVRSIDLRLPQNEGMNAVAQGDDTPHSLRQVLIDAVLNNKLRAFGDPFNDSTQLSRDEILSRLKDTGSLAPVVLIGDIWDFERARARMTVKLRSIAPAVTSISSDTTTGGQVLFWCRYREMAAVLKNYTLNVPKEPGHKIAFDKYFTDRFFSSVMLWASGLKEGTGSQSPGPEAEK